MFLKERARGLWFNVLAAAFRTALACTLVGVATLYGPSWLTRQVAFPAFSYVAVILIISDASFGDTCRACWLALYATVQSVGPAIITLRLIGTGRLTAPITALAAGLAGFVIVLPESTHLIAKRISLGQIVITYVIAYIHGEEADPVMHPVHVAASTCLAALSCVLALLLPCPRLATTEVRKSYKELAENTAQRTKLYVKAFCADDRTSSIVSISRAKILSASASKLRQTINRYQPSIKWEILPSMFLRREHCKDIEEKLMDSETTLRGMEMALASKSDRFPDTIIGEQGVKHAAQELKAHIGLAVKEKNNHFQQSDALTVNPESDTDKFSNLFLPLQKFPTVSQDLSPFFFLFCLKLLENGSVRIPDNNTNKSAPKANLKPGMGAIFQARKKRLIPALKLSISLGLATFLGAVYSKENAFWSGLPVAVSLAASREATFKVANVKAQGTVLGTVYGVLGWFVFERFMPLRFLSLLPWFLFSTFLSRSRMYGQAGGISAVIGAVLILGRKGFGPPSEFAIARITETFIGLSCSIFAELILQPTRASTLAKLHLSMSFQALHECFDSFRVDLDNIAGFSQRHKKFNAQVRELKKIMEEAEAEPNFWFSAFNSSCYGKLYTSLSKLVDLLHFGSQALRFLGKELGNEFCGDVMVFQRRVVTLSKSFEEITSTKTFNEDLEEGKSERAEYPDKEMLEAFLEHSKDLIERLEEGEEKSEWILGLSAFGYCVKHMVEEMREMGKRVGELVEWEKA